MGRCSDRGLYFLPLLPHICVPLSLLGEPRAAQAGPQARQPAGLGSARGGRTRPPVPLKRQLCPGLKTGLPL